MSNKEKLIELLDSDVLHKDGTTLEDVAEHLIANGVILPRWVPVTECLPQEDKPLETLPDLLFVRLNDGTITFGFCNRVEKRWYYLPNEGTDFYWDDFEKTPVVAWAPVQAPFVG